jgi:hypothetical protein
VGLKIPSLRSTRVQISPPAPSINKNRFSSYKMFSNLLGKLGDTSGVHWILLFFLGSLLHPIVGEDFWVFLNYAFNDFLCDVFGRIWGGKALLGLVHSGELESL